MYYSPEDLEVHLLSLKEQIFEKRFAITFTSLIAKSQLRGRAGDAKPVKCQAQRNP